MDLDKIAVFARELMINRCSHINREQGYIYFHGQRVGQIALQLRNLIFPRTVEFDEVILVGSWFHDLGKGIEPHWESGAVLVGDLLSEHCSPDELTKIKEIVVGHTLRKEREYPFYVQLVQDADILDHFGTQDIWLNFTRCGYTRKGMDDSLRFYDEVYDEQMNKIRSLLNFEESLEFFDEKDRFLREFIERFRAEGKGKLIKKEEKTRGWECP
ncbi:MAG: HD domain-containing protein [Bacillota bacterium]|nr:HD domain-containing protein [Bacillota bacterium]HHU62303.1 HD domain-containing protein [Natronincola sp.]